MTIAIPSTPDRLRDELIDAGASGFIHAVQVGHPRPRSVSYRAGVPVVMASVYKVPLLVALCRAWERGDLDPTARITIEPGEHTWGATGLSILTDPVTMSLRDLALTMIHVSDNTAADIIFDLVGVQPVSDTLAALGLRSTTITGPLRDQQERLRQRVHAESITAAMVALHDPDIDAVTHGPALFSTTTPADATTLLTAIWRDTAASPESCAFIRSALGHQVWQQRIASGFPGAAARVSAKSGTLGTLRNEIAVVEHPGEYPVAVAVFTRASRSEAFLPAVDRAIGQLARTAVTALRFPLP